MGDPSVAAAGRITVVTSTTIMTGITVITGITVVAVRSRVGPLGQGTNPPMAYSSSICARL